MRLDLQQWMGPTDNATGKWGKCTTGSIMTPQAPFFHRTSSPAGYSPLLLLQEGQYNNGRQVQVQTVKKTLRLVSQELVLSRYPNPQRASPAQHTLDLPISQLLKKYWYEDPLAAPKLAIPISTTQSSQKIIGGPCTSARIRPSDNCVLLPPLGQRVYNTCQAMWQMDNTLVGQQCAAMEKWAPPFTLSLLEP